MRRKREASGNGGGHEATIRAIDRQIADDKSATVRHLRTEVLRLTAERDELAALLRRAVGVVSDVERTRSEAAAVLDRYAELWPIGGRL